MMHHIVPLILSIALSMCITLMTQKIAIRYGKVAVPRTNRWHTTSTALFGGIAIYFTFLFLTLIFVSPITKEIFGILLGGTILFIIGIVDDLQHIGPSTKILAQIIAAIVTIFFEIKMEIFSPIISIPFTILWIVIITNAFNLLDNMDGLSAGIAFIIAVVLSIIFSMYNRTELSVLSLIIAGSSLGFLKYNFNPATIFMGDCGSMFLGFTIGALSIEVAHYRTSNLIMAISSLILIMAIPIFDTLLVTIIRSLNGRRIYQGGKDHVSHLLVILGLSEKQAVLLLYSLNIVTGIIAIFYHQLNFYMVVILEMLLLAGFISFGFLLAKAGLSKSAENDIRP